MNVYTTAMSLIASINKNQTVIIRNRQSIFDEATGVYTPIIKETIAAAQVQNTGSTIQQMGETATNTSNVYELWFINLTPIIVDALISTEVLNTEIELQNGQLLRLIEKEDYSYNGWIFCRAVQHAGN